LRIAPEKLDTALQRGLAPVYLLSGAEPLQAGECADAIRRNARAQGFADREVFFIDRANSGPWDEIFAAAQALSLFASRRVIEVRIPGAKPGTQGSAALLELAKLAGSDLLLLVITGEIDWTGQKSSWVQALDSAGVWIDAQPVPVARFPEWIRARAAAAGLTLDAEGLQTLAQQSEGNLLAAAQEIQKLRLAGHTVAGAPEVLASVTQSSRFDVAQLGEAVLRGDTARALRVLGGLRAEGVEATLVLWSLWQELRALWQMLLPGPPLPGVWSRNKAHLPAAAARLRPLGRACLAHIDARLAAADRIVKGRQWGNAWDELAQIVVEFSTGKPVLTSTSVAESA